jgi:N-acetylglutamate synthase-like GNAT family acetyltransferase
MEYFISTDKSKLDLRRIHDYIKNESYWGIERTKEETQATIDACLCFGIYLESGEQIGFARLVTDHVFFGYLMDFIIFEDYQSMGYGTKLMEFIMNHKTVCKLKTIGLKTMDAHAMYKKFGFKKIGDSPLWMAVDKQILNT